MKLTNSQFEALINYIDAAIEQKIDTCQSSDEGLISTSIKYKCLDELKKELCRE